MKKRTQHVVGRYTLRITQELYNSMRERAGVLGIPARKAWERAARAYIQMTNAQAKDIKRIKDRYTNAWF